MEVKMEPCIEIEPSKFVIVVGPRFTANVLSELTASRSPSCDHKAPIFAYKDIVNEGIALLLQTESDGEKTKYETLYRNAYELDPAFALRKVAVNLRKAERYQEWLDRLFGWRVEHSLEASPSLQHLLDLQRNGALLVYTHYDDLLDQAAELQPVLLKDAERWSAGECPGFLHVHGVLSEPGTVKLDCDFYETVNTHPSHQATAGALKAVFQQRHAVVVGFDACEDPLHSQFMETFLNEKDTRHVFVLDQATPPFGLPLVLSSPSFSVPLASAVSVTGESSWSLWRQVEFPSDNSEVNQSLGLLVTGKRGASEISKMMFQAPGVDFALVSSITHGAHSIHTVSIRVSSLRLKELWQWMFVAENNSLLSKGLLAVVMETGTFVWLRGKPVSTGDKLPSNSTENTHTIPSDKEVAMETNHSETNSGVKAILSQKPGHSARNPRGFLSPLPAQGLPAVPKGKKIPRYTVHKFKVKSGGTNGVSSLLRQKREFKDDSGIPGVPRSVLNRRPSLPPMKPAEVLPPVDQSTVLGRLAENLQNGTSSDAATSPPSYTAIKQALLADSYKRRQSVQIDPKTLKNLLQSKLASSEESALKRDLLSQRRNSDPGIYWKQRDFDRRRELFVDENESWSRNYGKVIDKRIVSWQKKRHERRQREFLRKQAQLSPNGQNSALKFQILNPLTTSQGIVAPYPTEVQAIPTAGPTSLVQPTPYLNPYLFPQQSLFTPSTTSVSTASMVYSPYVSPCNFVNPYSMQLANPQPTTYLIQAPPPSGAEQKVFYFVPSSTARTVSATPTGYTFAPSTTTMPQLSSLIAPTTAHTHVIKQHEVHMPDVDSRTESNVSSRNRKRKHTLPEKLSTLLQHQAEEDPESPTSPKKHKVFGDFHAPRTTTLSPPHSQPASALERHLLQPSPEHNGYHSNPEDREAEEIVGGAPYSPVGQRKDPPVVPAPRSQLQLWQFLLELLLISANSHLIQWTDNDLEFQINRPNEVALLWGKCTNNSGMNYEKLARGLRYYYSRGIMSKVPGRRLTFQYAGDVRSYVQLRRSQTVGSTEEVVLVE